MSNPSLAAADLDARRAPGMGGFNLTVLRLEVRRLPRNRRTMLFAVVMPVVFFLIFGLNGQYANKAAGHGNVSAFVMISMALYGAILATTSGGATVSIERAAGWSRQLRLTPLSPAAYIAIKMLTALVLALGSVVAVYVVGIIVGKPTMPAYLWIATGLCVWIGSLLFAAFGLFIRDGIPRPAQYPRSLGEPSDRTDGPGRLEQLCQQPRVAALTSATHISDHACGSRCDGRRVGTQGARRARRPWYFAPGQPLGAHHVSHAASYRSTRS